MSETNSTNIPKSRYVAGGATEVNQFRLEWWERITFKWDASDTKYVIDNKSQGRLDLIAQSFLGDSRLWWVLAQYNALLDPYNECTIGRVLRIPTQARVQTFLNGKLGGYASTREIPLSNIVPIV